MVRAFVIRQSTLLSGIAPVAVRSGGAFRNCRGHNLEILPRRKLDSFETNGSEPFIDLEGDSHEECRWEPSIYWSCFIDETREYFCQLFQFANETGRTGNMRELLAG